MGNGNQFETIDNIKKIFKSIFPSKIPEITFLDEQINTAYIQYDTFGKIILYLTILAIFIAGLGLFGLISFITEIRTKEIGIRKVLGSSVEKIVYLLSKEFIKLIIISVIISWIAGFYLMDKWLQNFVYRININIWIFVLSGFIAVSIALFAISFQSIKSALLNPVDAIRYE